MLKFLENRNDDQICRRTIRYKPHITFGISLESPKEFQKEFSMISNNTFVNPYLSY